MRKILKSSAAFVMGAVFAFTGVACTTSNSGNSENNGSSNGGTSSSTALTKTELCAAYADNLLTKLGNAQSVKITFSMEGSSSSKSDYVDANVEDSDYVDEVSFQGTLILSKTEEGDFAANVEGRAIISEKDNADPDAAPEKEEKNVSVYILDEMIYVYNPDVEGYVVSSYEDALSSVSSELPMVIEMLKTVGFPSDSGDLVDNAELSSALAMLLESTAEVTESSCSFSFEKDLKAGLNALIVAINSIDEEKTTLGDLINRILVFVAPDSDLTVDSILTQLTSMGTMTVGQILTFVDSFLAKSNTSLQGIKNQLLSDETIVSLLKETLNLTDAQIQEFKSKTIVAIVAQMMGLTEAQVSAFTIDDILTMIFSAQGDGEDMVEITLGELIDAYVTPTLNSTLSELEFSLPDLDGMIINKANVSAKGSFGSDMQFSNVEFSSALGYSVTEIEKNTNGIPYVTRHSKVDSTITAKIENISSSKATIALPADAKIVYALWNLNFKTSLDNPEASQYSFSIKLFPPHTVESSDVEFSGAIYLIGSTGYVGTYFFNYVPVSAFPDEITITITGASVNGRTLTQEQLTAQFPDGTCALKFFFDESGSPCVDLTDFSSLLNKGFSVDF